MQSEFSSDMRSEPIVSDGERTVGYVDGIPAEWEGNLVELKTGELFWPCSNDAKFQDGNEEYLIHAGEWWTEEALAIDIIRRNVSYIDAYGEMMDSGVEDPDVYWYRHIDQCGEGVASEEDNPEPNCNPGKEHEWASPHSVLGGLEENPGVHKPGEGAGGGVVITEVCSHCGFYRIRDTLGTNPETGEQGLESVEYDDADEASLSWIGKNIFVTLLNDLKRVQEPFIDEDDGIVTLTFSIYTEYDEDGDLIVGDEEFEKINEILERYGLTAGWTGNINAMKLDADTEDVEVSFRYSELGENGTPEDLNNPEPDSEPSGPGM